SWGRVLRGQAALLAVFAVTLLAVLAPAYIAGGDRSLLFWSYHRQRGIESYSTWAAVTGALKHLFAVPATVRLEYGSSDVFSAASPALVGLATWLTPAGLLAV